MKRFNEIDWKNINIENKLINDFNMNFYLILQIL